MSAWFHHQFSVKGAIDELCSDLGEEFYLPLSTSYSWLSMVREWCLRQASRLGLNPNGLKSLWELRQVPEAAVIGVRENPAFPNSLIPP